MAEPDDEATRIPIDGVLDLHTFRPSDVKDLVPEYLDACAQKGIRYVRIIHGKGTGTLRKLVHSVLESSEMVASYRLAGDGGGWGATVVTLREEALRGEREP